MNIEDLDFAGRRCPVKAKGARTEARRRGQAREDYVLDTVCWDAGTARLLPRLLKGRTRGPVFVTHRRPGPGKVVSPRDVCRVPGWPACRTGSPRAAGRAHGLGPARVPLMAKPRHKKPENVRRCFKPSPEAIAELTSLLAHGDDRR